MTTHTLSPRLAAFAVALCSLVLAACGDSSSEDSSPTPAASGTSAAGGVAGAVGANSPANTFIDAASADIIWDIVATTPIDTLSVSLDQGVAWQKRTLPTNADHNMAVSFMDGSYGWLATQQNSANCSAIPSQLWQTANGANSWQPLMKPAAPEGSCLVAPLIVDASNGYVVAVPPGRAPVVFRTTDARNWTGAAPLADPPGGTFTGSPGIRRVNLYRFDSTLLLETVASGGRQIYRSTDNGATWAHARTVKPPDQTFAVVTATRWLLLGASSTGSQETMDAGATWRPFTTDYTQPSTAPSDVVFGSPQVGFATQAGALFRTTDGGAHWTRITKP